MAVKGFFFFLHLRSVSFSPESLSLQRSETNPAVSAEKASCQHSIYTATAAKEWPQWFFRAVALYMTSAAPKEGVFRLSQISLTPFLSSFQYLFALPKKERVSSCVSWDLETLGSVFVSLCSFVHFLSHKILVQNSREFKGVKSKSQNVSWNMQDQRYYHSSWCTTSSGIQTKHKRTYWTVESF